MMNFMPTTSDVLRHYRALEAASHEMVHAARTQDWDRVCRLEAACAVVIGRLRDMAPDTLRQPEEQAERMRILRTILANDAEVRRICASDADYRPESAWVMQPSMALH